MSDRPALRALADRAGILPEYRDLAGARHETADRTRELLLAAMGLDAGDEAAARGTLEGLERADAERLLPPVLVLERPRRAGLRVEATPPERARARVEWTAELVEEGGARQEAGGRAPVRDGSARIRLPWRPEPGYHTLRLRIGPVECVAPLIVTPPTGWTVSEALGDRRVFGIWGQLYGLRSATDWGVGDLADLRRLGEWAAEQGAAFLGVNPLHALWNRGDEISPYSPVSRLFRNPIYLAVPEVTGFDPSLAPEAASLEPLRTSSRVEYQRVWALKRKVLEAIHRRLREGEFPELAAYRRRQGAALRDFATFLALDDHHSREGGPRWWREWPDGHRRPGSPEVEAFRREHAAEVDFHIWCQFELDRQLARAQESVRAAGMPLGLYQDLAVGSSAGGSDAWAFDGLFSEGASVGAPPDQYAPGGQDWGFPPLVPARLEAGGYDYWIRLVRAGMTHAGALRIDHALGLRRLFWIPPGGAPADGAYVRYPERELLGILALESRRSRVVVVAEDLGTVPPGFPAALARKGILSSRLLFFERDEAGRFRPASSYQRRAFVTVTTHDHATVPAFWAGEDLALRRSLGEIDAEGFAARQAQRVQERAALLERLRADRLLARDAEPASPAEMTALLHRFLDRAPAPLLGLSLDDLVGETAPVNVPGVGPDRFAAWTRRSRLSVETIRRDPDVAAGLRAVEARAWNGA